MKVALRYRLWALMLALWFIGGNAPLPISAQGGGNLDLLLLVDSTGSTADTDPQALRIDASRFLLDYMQAVSEAQGLIQRFAAANFNTTTLDEIPWTLLQGEAGRDQLVARSIGGTDFGPALEYALRLRQEPGGAETLGVVLFTDGAPCPVTPCPQGAALETYFQGLEESVAALHAAGAEIFVVALGDNSTASNWSALVGASHYRFVDASTDLAGVYHDFFADLLGLGTEAARPLRDGDSTSFMVEPYLEQLVLSIIKADRIAQVTVTDPFGGTPVPARGGGEGELHAVYVVPSPAVGRWQVRVTGGAAQVYVDRQYATLVLDAPSSPQALSAPIQVTGQLLRRGVVIRDDPDLQLSLTATGPGQTAATFDLAPRVDGRHLGVLTDLTVEGVYTLTLNGEWGGQPVGARQTEAVTVSVFAVPALDQMEIQSDLIVGHPLTVTVAIVNADRIGSETEVFARLLRADGSVVEVPALRDDGSDPDTTAGDGIFSTALNLPAAVGRYRLECVLQGVSRDGVTLSAATPQQVLDVRNSLPTPIMTPTPTPPPPPPGGFDVPDLGRRYPWLIIGLVLGGLVVAGYLGYQLARIRGKWQQAETASANEAARAIAEKNRADTEAKRADTEKIRAEQERARAEAAEDTFLKQAEVWYRAGKDCSSRGEYEEAREAFGRYFQILKQGFEKLQIDVMPNLSEAAAGLFATLEHLPAEERQKTLLEQARLVITPELDAARFHQMAYALPDLWKQEEAIENLYALFEQGGQRDSLLKAIAETGKPPLASIAETWRLAMDEPTPSALHRVAVEVAEANRPGIRAVAEWLQSLAQYAEPPRLSADTVIPVIEALKESGPLLLIDLVDTAARGLIAAPVKDADESSAEYWGRVNDYLETGLAQLRGRVNAQLPEMRILFKLTHRWLFYVQEQRENLMQPPDVQFDMLSALALTQREEELKRGYWLIDVPVNLLNVGHRPALDVVVTIRANYNPVTFLPNSQQEINPVVGEAQPGERFVQRLSGLAGGQARHLTFRMEAQERADCRLQIDVAYVEEKVTAGAYQRLPKQCEPQNLHIAPLVVRQDPLPRSNPFTTGPLLNDTDWEQMGKAQAPQTVQEIVAKLESLHTAGRFLQIVGLRRTGKTTILKRALISAAALNTEDGAPKYICVYLDLNRWLEEMAPYRSKIAEDSALWHTILSEIYHQCESQLPGALRDRISKTLQIGKRFTQDSMPLSLPEVPIGEFRALLSKVQHTTQRTLCLALDEGDVLADLQPTLDYQGTVRDLPSAPASTPLTRIMSALQGLVDDQETVVLLVRGFGEAIWEQEGMRTPGALTTGRFDVWYTYLLDKTETLSIADLGKFQFTELGRETFWQLTGGYPLLVQVLGDYLYKQRADGFLKSVVSNGVIKRAVFDIMTTPAGAETLDFMRYGFKREEEMALKTLAVWFTDYATRFVKELRYGGESASITGTETVLARLREQWPQTWENLGKDWLVQIIDRLKVKELFEVRSCRLCWRVGWLCLLMQEVMVEDGDFADNKSEESA